MKKFILFCLIIPIVQSCSPVSTISISSKDKFSTLRRDSDIKVNGPQVVTKPLLANLEIDMERKKTTLSTTISYSLSKEFARKEAEQKAEFLFIDEHQCDFVLDPYFDTEISHSQGDGFYRINVVITGLSVTYKKFSEIDSLPKIFTQLNNLPSRSLPLITSFTSQQKNFSENENEKGFVIGAGLGWFSGNESLIYTANSNTNFVYFNKATAYFAFYRVFPINNGLSCRSELGLFSRNYAIETMVMNGGPKVKYDVNSLGIDFPILLDLRINNKFNLHLGPSINLLLDESINRTPNLNTNILSQYNNPQTRLALNAGFNLDLEKYYIGTRFFSQILGEQDRLMSGLGFHIGFKI